MNASKVLWILLLLPMTFFFSTCPSIADDHEEWLLNSGGIQGSPSEASRALLNNVSVQRILLKIAREPRGREYLEPKLEKAGASLEQLVESGFVRLDQGRYVIDYLLFTKEDMLMMREITDEHARYLADAILRRSSELDRIMEQYELKGVDTEAILYIILACFSLDWDGLVVSADRGYRIPDKGEGERVIVQSWEPCDLSRKGFYKGSHNSTFGKVTFTSFGDHEIQPRAALPDIFWRVPRNAVDDQYPEALQSGIKEFVEASVHSAGEQLGLIMLALRTGGAKSSEALAEAVEIDSETVGAYLDFLMKLDYIEETEGRYQSRIPVLTTIDSPVVKEVLSIGREELERYFDTHYRALREELSKLTPFRHGVDLADYFYEIWHDIFGAANLILVEEGLFADPYSERYGANGIIPAVYDSIYVISF